MRHIILFLIFLLPASITFTSLGQTPDSIPAITVSKDTFTIDQNEDYHYDIDDGFAPGLAIFALFAFVVMFICIGAGIVLTVLALLILFGLIGAGIVSSSILVSLYSKSIEKGFKTFVVSVTAICGLLIGTLGFWFLNKIAHWFPTNTALTIGSLSGLITGLLLGLLLFYVIKKLTSFLKSKLKNI